MTCETLQGKYAEKLEKEIKKMNKEIELLYKKLDAQDKIIDEQALEMAQLKEDKKKAIEYIQNHQLVFELSSKKQISSWFDMFYKELLEILGDNDAKN